jgi:hypothetical protein
MPSVSIWIGRILIIIGVIGYAYGFFGGKASITAMIPAFFGIVLLALGHFALVKESLSKHLMHTAVIVALLGFLLPAGRVISKLSEVTLNAAYISQISMALVCLIFVVLAVRSFISARKA